VTAIFLINVPFIETPLKLTVPWGNKAESLSATIVPDFISDLLRDLSGKLTNVLIHVLDDMG
jgi:hypothetical protein